MQYIKGPLEERNLSRTRGILILFVRNVKAFWSCQPIRNDRHGIVAGFNQILKRPTISRPKSLVNFCP